MSNSQLPIIALGALGLLLLLKGRSQAQTSTTNVVTPTSLGPVVAPVVKPSGSTVPLQTPVSSPTSVTSLPDTYCDWLLTQDDNDMLYDYALSSTSLSCIEKAATRLAAASDTRAINLTQRLADFRKGAI